MNINLDVIIGTPDHEIDMKFGLETLTGTSDVVTLTTEGILSNRVTKNITHATPVKTTMKHSFKGSYGMNFTVNIEDQFLKKRLKAIGRDVVIELIAYFVSESLYIEHPKLSKEAEEQLNQMGERVNELIDRIRNPLIKMHQVPVKYNYDVKLSYKQRGHDKKQVCKLTNTTALSITEAKRANYTQEIEAYITRFNSLTGNGRLMLKDTDETISFGLDGLFVSKANKKLLSANLDVNTEVVKEEIQYMNLRVQPLKLKSKKVVKYFIKGIT
ncbi:hypothetical protein [Pseudoalteromonas piscicida]